MQIIFIEEAREDCLVWQKEDKKVVKKINSLIKDISRNPFTGVGSPEPLKHNLSGYWSRRITLEHRLVYRIKDDSIRIIQCRYHY